MAVLNENRARPPEGFESEMGSATSGAVITARSPSAGPVVRARRKGTLLLTRWSPRPAHLQAKLSVVQERTFERVGDAAADSQLEARIVAAEPTAK